MTCFKCVINHRFLVVRRSSCANKKCTGILFFLALKFINSFGKLAGTNDKQP